MHIKSHSFSNQVIHVFILHVMNMLFSIYIAKKTSNFSYFFLGGVSCLIWNFVFIPPLLFYHFYLFCQLPLLWTLLFFTVMCFHLHHHLQTSLTLSFCNSLLPLSSCRPTKTQTEASVSAVFLARLEDPPHNQTGAKLILPSHSPDWTSLGQTNTKYFIWYIWTICFCGLSPWANIVNREGRSRQTMWVQGLK